MKYFGLLAPSSGIGSDGDLQHILHYFDHFWATLRADVTYGRSPKKMDQLSRVWEGGMYLGWGKF